MNESYVHFFFLELFLLSFINLDKNRHKHKPYTTVIYAQKYPMIVPLPDAFLKVTKFP